MGRKDEILRYVRNPKAFAKLPTKIRPKIDRDGNVVIRLEKDRVHVRPITVEDIDSLAKSSACALNVESMFRCPNSALKRA